MAHKYEQSDSENDLLRARFTLWLNTTLIRAKQRYLETHTDRLDIVPLDETLTELIPDTRDFFNPIERSKTDFDFEEEKLAKAFSELSLMRREVLRLLFVEEKPRTKLPDSFVSLRTASISSNIRLWQN